MPDDHGVLLKEKTATLSRFLVYRYDSCDQTHVIPFSLSPGKKTWSGTCERKSDSLRQYK